MGYSKKSILQALAYFDIFDYPLTFEQIYQYLPDKTTKEKLQKDLSSIKSIKRKGEFYFLKNQSNNVLIRQQREKASREKLLLIKKISKIFELIPTIQLLAISGALSMKNCEEEDDIDLFVVTKKGTLWSTRLVLLFILELLGHRRKKGDKHTKNKMCLNMILDEDGFALSKKRQNLYGAHEITQMIPLFERKNTYNRFIIANNWIFKFLPNAKQKKVTYSKNDNYLLSLIVYIIEPIAKFVQKNYMGRITKEEITNTLLAFHPIDYQSKILSAYKKKLKALV